MKYSIINAITAISKSRPARGAWIEIVAKVNILIPSFSRAPHGARGLKLLLSILIKKLLWSRAPHGARGLKWDDLAAAGRDRGSRPARGAWIEIYIK